MFLSYNHAGRDNIVMGPALWFTWYVERGRGKLGVLRTIPRNEAIYEYTGLEDAKTRLGMPFTGKAAALLC